MVKQFSILLLVLLISCEKANHPSYPPIDAQPVKDVYHGQSVSDPYRLLEDLENEVVKTWFSEQKSFYDSTLSTLTFRDSLKKELSEIFSQEGDYTMMPRPFRGGFYFCRYSYKEGVEKVYHSDPHGISQQLIVRMDSLGLGDVNIDFYEPSPNGTYLALGMSENGTEMSVIRILDVRKKILLPDRIVRAMGGNPQWLPDESGFFYQQMKETTVETDQERYQDSAVKLHLLGSVTDKVIVTRTLNRDLSIEKIDYPQLWVFPSSDNVILSLTSGTSKFSRLYHACLDDILHKAPEQVKWNLLNGVEDKISSFALKGSDLFVLRFHPNIKGQVEM